MTTDAINYLEAITLGYIMADHTEKARLFKALPSKHWQGLMAGIAQAMEQGDKPGDMRGAAVRAAICKALQLTPIQTNLTPMSLVYEALKKAESKARAEKLRPEITKLVAAMSSEELDQLDKEIRETQRVKRQAKEVEQGLAAKMAGSQQAPPARTPATGATAPAARTVATGAGNSQGAQAKQK